MILTRIKKFWRSMILAAQSTKDSKAKKMMESGAYNKLKVRNIFSEIESFVLSRRMRRLKKNTRNRDLRGKPGSKKLTKKERS